MPDTAVIDRAAPAGPVVVTPVPPGPAVIEHSHLKALLPHRHPILQVDRVLELEPDRRIVAVKAISGAEPCYADLGADGDHAYPASLLLESLGQTAAVLWLRSAELAGRPTAGTLIFGAARDIEFPGPALPGDVLRHVVELESDKGDNALLRGETWVGDRLVASVGSMHVALRGAAELSPA
ncbi:beta-hydroxyacyl-ACP dehydratase [Actinokineospora sp. PR83]|uniref:3-hydroxyacyl-ACP dehydratase FabZ family protein n=1 Tax=Actinokineospora sp. PR83 TaxID=2884908 RepID=UPI0027E0769F|nr:beta-hydroxyacyl-ACP dehydratase [Actinokineospora sp. PR83]MCG8914797.1 beta-hydroxyacyl-ACP dehydratase [Actinokineospora sp. PR83]